jgi:ribosomal protein S14
MAQYMGLMATKPRRKPPKEVRARCAYCGAVKPKGGLRRWKQLYWCRHEIGCLARHTIRFGKGQP